MKDIASIQPKDIASIQEAMARAAEPGFSEADNEQLRAVVRIALEVTRKLKNGIDDLGYELKTVLSGLDSFVVVLRSYKVLIGAGPSELDWSKISFANLNDAIFERCDMFLAETEPLHKLRLLLDLYRLLLTLMAASLDG